MNAADVTSVSDYQQKQWAWTLHTLHTKQPHCTRCWKCSPLFYAYSRYFCKKYFGKCSKLHYGYFHLAQKCKGFICKLLSSWFPQINATMSWGLEAQTATNNSAPQMPPSNINEFPYCTSINGALDKCTPPSSALHLKMSQHITAPFRIPSPNRTCTIIPPTQTSGSHHK